MRIKVRRLIGPEGSLGAMMLMSVTESSRPVGSRAPGLPQDNPSPRLRGEGRGEGPIHDCPAAPHPEPALRAASDLSPQAGRGDRVAARPVMRHIGAMVELAVKVENLVKHYSGTVAVDGISFAVARG